MPCHRTHCDRIHIVVGSRFAFSGCCILDDVKVPLINREEISFVPQAILALEVWYEPPSHLV